MAAVRQANVSWSGDFLSGKGNVSAASSGAFKQLEVSWPRRSEPDAQGKTSPEELLAASHASCYAMALSNGLGQAGTPPVNARATGSRTPPGLVCLFPVPPLSGAPHRPRTGPSRRR